MRRASDNQAQYRDAAGVVHRRAGAPARLVSLVPSITELLFDLGLGDRVVGRTRYCVHPRPAVAALPEVGGTKRVRIPALLALAPTHVVANIEENDRAQVERIAAAGIRVITTYPRAPEDNTTLYRLLGALFDREAQAERLASTLEHERVSLLAMAASWPERRALYLIWRKPWMCAGADTYIARTLALARWRVLEPPASTGRYPRVDLDASTLARADLVLLPSEPYPFTGSHVAELHRLAGKPSTPIVAIDGEMTSWYGSRAITGLRYLGALRARLERAAA